MNIVKCQNQKMLFIQKTNRNHFSTTVMIFTSQQQRFFRANNFPVSTKYHEILGVPRHATDKDIKKAYYKLAKKYHPDANKSDKIAEKKFQEITNAYETLIHKQIWNDTSHESPENIYQTDRKYQQGGGSRLDDVDEPINFGINQNRNQKFHHPTENSYVNFKDPAQSVQGVLNKVLTNVTSTLVLTLMFAAVLIWGKVPFWK